MTAYLIRYQIRRRGRISIPRGDWQDEEKIVVAGDDGREAINEIVDSITNYDFRLRSVEEVRRVDRISKRLTPQKER